MEKASPEVFGATLVAAAGSHFVGLRQALEKERTGQPDEKHWNAAFAELLRAHFGLVSLHVCRCLRDAELSNFYGHSMLQFLREYPDSKLPQVRNAFSDDPNLDDAISCDVNGQPSSEDKAAIEDSRKFLQLSEDNPLLVFAGKVHIRVMRALGIPKYDFRWLLCWAANVAAVAAAPELYFQFEPAAE